MLAELEMEAPPREFPPRAHRVLCVDDERPVLDALRRLLRREPYDLMTTERPEQALEWIAHGGISLVVADQRMPVMTGTELLEAARVISPEMIGVILTAYPRTSVLLDAVNQGARRLIAKPWDDDALKEAIRDLLARSEWIGKTRFVGPAHGEEAVEPGVAGVLEERVVRIDCRGKTAEAALRPISAILRHPKVIRTGIVILLERLNELDDPERLFLPGLVSRTETSGIRPSVVDATGRARTHLENLGGAKPYVAYGPEVSARHHRYALLVADDPEAGDLIAALVRAGGITCDVPESPDEAMMRLGMTPYDLVVLAIDRPGAPGGRAGRYVRERGLGVPVLLLSPSLDRWDTDDCTRLAVERMLPLPCRVRDLYDALGGNGGPI